MSPDIHTPWSLVKQRNYKAEDHFRGVTKVIEIGQGWTEGYFSYKS
jgi:hypothetical protein